jgi:hypothetical protein
VQYDPNHDWLLYIVALGGPLFLLLAIASSDGVFRYGCAFPGKSSEKAYSKAKDMLAEYTKLLKEQPNVYDRHPHKTWREIFFIESLASEKTI